jgi:hypothetical protein
MPGGEPSGISVPMLSESNLRDPLLINTIGHTAGLLLFGFIIALLLRDRRAYALGETKLSILAAALAFGWNAGSLIALGAGNLGSPFMQVVTAVSFAVLSLLPAVLLQVILRGQLPVVTRRLCNQCRRHRAPCLGAICFQSRTASNSTSADWRRLCSAYRH